MFKSEIIKLHFGLEKPIRILQLSDVHLSLADDVDGDDMKAHAAARRNTFFNEANFPERDPVGYLKDAMEYAKDFDCTVITGDVLDFTSHANRVTATEILAGKDYLFCAGNHEFCPKVGIPDSFARKDEILDEIQACFRGNMIFESRIVGGVNVIAIDNSYYIWTEKQLELLKAEVARGLPVILFCHSPLTGGNMNHNPTHRDLHVSDEVIDFTRKVTQYIIDEPAIKAVFSGHYHSTMTEQLGDKTGYILGGLFKGIVGEIIID
ncbi:MAG: metallophosphoesterase [Clostridia bacterium]|nr:metallophosphoesterase [Clostridia bacterium]MBQ5820959.1 metallophosphoesterase [Clostridia bacterium]